MYVNGHEVSKETEKLVLNWMRQMKKLIKTWDASKYTERLEKQRLRAEEFNERYFTRGEK